MLFCCVPVTAATVEQRAWTEIIDRARRDAGMTQDELARERGEDPSQFSKQTRGVGRILDRTIRIRNARFWRSFYRVLGETVGVPHFSAAHLDALSALLDEKLEKLQMARAGLRRVHATQPTRAGDTARAECRKVV